MNILHTVFSFNSGGIENLLVDIVNNWNEKKDNLIICVINNDYNIDLINRINNSSNCKVVLLNRNRGSKNIKFIYDYIKVIITNKVDIIHCHLYEVLKIVLFAKIIKPKIKIYYTVHDTNIYRKFNKRAIALQNIFVKKIIAISEAVKKDIVARNNKCKIEVVPNAIDVNRFIYEKEISKYVSIGCIARIMPEKKGQDILIKAIKIVKEKYPNVKCYFAGEPKKGDEYELEKLKELVNNLDLQEDVIFLGNVNNIPKFLAKLDIFVLPSRYEGFGIVLLESMAAKVPVIASKLEGPQEIILDNKFGELFDVGDYKTLAQIIIKLISNKNQKKINESYQYVKQYYNIDIINNKLKKIYYEGKNGYEFRK
ncbi:glycosyltransferase [Clostridium sp.]|uniref:glycosyltransferase n=1 Tax=Clostridium sp. TaxID=1506 RepID=UPI0039904732